MQTFLPYPLYGMTARILDRKRLFSSLVEGRLAYNIITGKIKSAKWEGHPVVLMWKPYPYALSLYLDTLLAEWLRRGYKTLYKPLRIKPANHSRAREWWPRPEWLLTDSDLFCLRHRAALLKKNRKYYKKFKWSERPSVNYWWPITAITKRDYDDQFWDKPIRRIKKRKRRSKRMVTRLETRHGN